MTEFHRTALYGPNSQMFICETKEQLDRLTFAGWKDVAPKAPVWVKEWDKVVLRGK